MPNTWVEPEEVLRHNDVTVYHTYKDREMDYRRTYWFTTNIVEEPENDFDIRDLSTYVNGKDFKEILKEAIDRGEVAMPKLEDTESQA